MPLGRKQQFHIDKFIGLNLKQIFDFTSFPEDVETNEKDNASLRRNAYSQSTALLSSF